MYTTNVITAGHPAAPYVVVVDKDGNPIPNLLSYNIDTKEAELLVKDEKNHVIIENHQFKTCKKTFKDSVLRFIDHTAEVIKIQFAKKTLVETKVV